MSIACLYFKGMALFFVSTETKKKKGSWRGCELRHSVASTPYNLAVRDARSRGGKSGSTKSTGLVRTQLAAVLPRSDAAFMGSLT